MKAKVLFFILMAGSVTLLNCSSKSSEKKETSENPTGAVGKANSAPVYLTTENFKTKVFDFEHNTEWKYQGDLPCIIDFYADWCGPCKRVAPIMEDLAKEYSGKVRIYKVNTDQEKELSTAFGIQSIPAVLFVPKEGKPQMMVGAMPRESYDKAISELLLPAGGQEKPSVN